MTEECPELVGALLGLKHPIAARVCHHQFSVLRKVVPRSELTDEDEGE